MDWRYIVPCGWFYIPGGVLWMIALEMFLPRSLSMYASLVSVGAITSLVFCTFPEDLYEIRGEIKELKWRVDHFSSPGRRVDSMNDLD